MSGLPPTGSQLSGDRDPKMIPQQQRDEARDAVGVPSTTQPGPSESSEEVTHWSRISEAEELLRKVRRGLRARQRADFRATQEHARILHFIG